MQPTDDEDGSASSAVWDELGIAHLDGDFVEVGHVSAADGFSYADGFVTALLEAHRAHAASAPVLILVYDFDEEPATLWQPEWRMPPTPGARSGALTYLGCFTWTERALNPRW